MSQVTSEQAMAMALAHHQAGRFDQAEAIYRGILASQPDHVHALHSLGVLEAQTGRLELAALFIGRAIANKPDFGQAYSDLGGVLLQLGRKVEAIAAFERALAFQPDNVETLCNHGVALIAAGRLQEAATTLGRAIRLKPGLAAAHNNLGNVLKDLGRLDEAIEEYHAAIAAKPEYFEALINLGNVYCAKKEHPRAIENYQRAIAIKPDLASAHNQLGIALEQMGRWNESLAAFDRAIALEPEYSEAHNNRAVTLEAMGRLEDAASAFGRAAQLQPGNAKIYSNLGTVLHNAGQLDAAILAFRDMARAQPNNPAAYVSLGGVLTERGHLTEALHEYNRALELDGNCAAAFSNLGTTLKEMGRLDEALAAYRRAVEIEPGNTVAHSNLVYAVSFHPDYDARKIFEEARGWARVHEQAVAAERKPHTNDRSPERRLKIGYVSPDFFGHVVGRNLLPLMMHHNHAAVDVFLYSGVLMADSITSRLRESADHWRETARKSGAELAEQIRRDGIDILVDLTLHMAGSRLRVFARKPAPVQVTYLGYCGTTGLDAMDYRLSDPHMDPPVSDLSCYSEETILLPRTFWCYCPNLIPEPTGIPSVKRGQITFGCLNNFAKVSAPAMDLWGAIMNQVPASRLILHALEGEHRQRARERFARQGISADRIEFIGKQPLEDYARTYERIDITLDPFPYGGGITTCDSLWQGVPVVTLQGGIAVGRGGVSVLSNVRLGDCIAKTREEYLTIAVRLAEDEARRIHLRSELRSMMQNSPLLDGRQFAMDVESAYRRMWKAWCER